MKSISLKNAKFGLDTRRDVLTSQLGTFVTLENCHVNQGGEIEGRKAFVKLGQLPQQTYGFEALPDTLVTFGSRAVTLRTSNRQRAAGVATLTFPARSMPTTTNHDFLVGDSVTVLGLGGAGYNITATITAIAATTISFACPGGDEAITADTGGTVSVVFLTGVQYQRLRHWRFYLGVQNLNDNVNTMYEPAMDGIVDSRCFGGKTLALASFAAQTITNLDSFDPYYPWVGTFSNGVPVDSSFQGQLDIVDSFYSGGGAKNYNLIYPFIYTAANTLGPVGLTTSFGAPADNSVSILGPVNQAFSLSVSDTVGGQLSTSLFSPATTNTVAVGGSTVIYLTKGSAGKISALTAPDIQNGVVVQDGVDLLNGQGDVNYDRSLFQTAIDLATRINSTSQGYSAQASQVTSVTAAVTIVAPASFGALVNGDPGGGVKITTTTIFVSKDPIKNSGAVGAATVFNLTNGVTAAQGTGQIQRVVFGVPQYPLGTYVVTLTFNGIDYQLGAGNLTTKRASTSFFLISGGAGSVGPLLLPDGTNLLGTDTVTFDTDLFTTAHDIASSINTKWGGGGLNRANSTSWCASVSTVTVGASTLYGVSISAPTVSPQSYNGLSLNITSATIQVGKLATDAGATSIQCVIDGATVAPTSLFAMGQKAYMTRGDFVNFSKLNDGSRWENSDTGAGFFRCRDIAASPAGVLGLGAYQGKLAALARHNIQIWNIDADPAKYSQFQNLQNIGTVDGRSVQSIGELDLLFLADNGVRSLRARETSLNAFVADIGAPIDQTIIDSLIAGPNTNICSIVEPGNNRFWLVLNGTIYVLSYFPNIKITAWSTYKPTDSQGNVFVPEELRIYNGQVYIRDTNRNVYVYGGANNQTYDGSVVTVETPWLDDKTPFTPKQFRGVHVAIQGMWKIYAGSDPKAGLTELVLSDGDPLAGNVVNDSTFDKGGIGYEAQGTHGKLKFVSDASNTGKVLIGEMSLLYDEMTAV